MAIDLYYMNASPPCRAVLMTAKQLNIELNIKNIDLDKLEHLTPEYLKLNPAHTVPTMVDQDFVLWESRAIMQYLCNKYAPDNSLYPSEPKKRALVDRVLNTDLTYFLANRDALVMKIVLGIEPTEQNIKNYKNNLKLMETLIGDSKYFAGNELTLADLSVLATTTLLTINDWKDLKDCPKLKLWFERMQTELPYYDQVNGKVPEEFRIMAIELAKLRNQK